MYIIDLLILATIVLLGMFVTTQIVAPLIKGTPIFPILRTDSQQMKHKLELAKHVTEIRKLEVELAKEKQRAANLEKESNLNQGEK